MNKQYTVSPYAVLAFFSFVGALTFLFLFVIGNINLVTAISGTLFLSALGITSIVTLVKGKDNPVLKNILKLVVMGLLIILALFIIGAVMIGAALS